ncbi:MAG: hypothetical protein ACE37F_34090 [Nannocystaceae bacterium]|nr:hypothetical protein [bacterium]
MNRRGAALVMSGLGLGLVQCSEPKGRANVDTALVDLELREVEPGTVLVGSTLVITGDAFVDDPWGESTLVLDGEIDTGAEKDGRIVRLPARFVDFTRLEVDIDADAFALLGDGASAQFEGTAQVEVRSTVDGRLYRSQLTDVDFRIAPALDPELTVLTPSSVIFPNEPLEVTGHGLLLGDEGTSRAVIEGCFTPAGGDTCTPVAASSLVITANDPLCREAGVFAFEPSVAGIEPGRFEGTLTFANEHVTGTVTTSAPTTVTWDLVEPTLYGVDTTSASLGRYITIEGAGFLGGAAGGDTVLRFDGIFTPDASGVPIVIDELLFPEFTDGRHVRYVVNEEDGLSAAIDMRNEPGLFEGLVTPVISYQGVEVEGSTSPLGFRLEPVRQVVWVNFTTAYTEALRSFGLRAVDSHIRARALDVIRRDFATLGLEIRVEVPTDYALYSEVDIGGRDPNGLGLLGYDNTPGKDTDNLRLYDRIGGANAQTQEDGFPGYGGVFIESLFGYSEHPGDLAEPVRPDARFDMLFDPFRPDIGGQPVLAADLGSDVAHVDPAQCPVSGDRPRQIACAIHALGTLVGSTISHELGHSLGLADPYGPSIHNEGDQDDRLMDADRPFEERAELEGAGPSRFCADEYEYLRQILPSSEDYDLSPRAPCY